MKCHLQNKSDLWVYCSVKIVGWTHKRLETQIHSFLGLRSCDWIISELVPADPLPFIPPPALLQYKSEGIEHLKIWARGYRKTNLDGVAEQRRIKDIKSWKSEERRRGRSYSPIPLNPLWGGRFQEHRMTASGESVLLRHLLVYTCICTRLKVPFVLTLCCSSKILGHS